MYIFAYVGFFVFNNTLEIYSELRYPTNNWATEDKETQNLY